jgi:hypothetical protein
MSIPRQPTRIKSPYMDRMEVGQDVVPAGYAVDCVVIYDGIVLPKSCQNFADIEAHHGSSSSPLHLGRMHLSSIYLSIYIHPSISIYPSIHLSIGRPCPTPYKPQAPGPRLPGSLLLLTALRPANQLIEPLGLINAKCRWPFRTDHELISPLLPARSKRNMVPALMELSLGFH